MQIIRQNQGYPLISGALLLSVFLHLAMMMLIPVNSPPPAGPQAGRGLSVLIIPDTSKSEVPAPPEQPQVAEKPPAAEPVKRPAESVEHRLTADRPVVAANMKSEQVTKVGKHPPPKPIEAVKKAEFLTETLNQIVLSSPPIEQGIPVGELEMKRKALSARQEEETRTLLLSWLRQALEQHKYYPRRAWVKRWEGTVLMGFDVESTRGITNITILRSSGYQLLDKSAEKTLMKIASLGPPPVPMHGQTIALGVPVEFQR